MQARRRLYRANASANSRRQPAVNSQSATQAQHQRADQNGNKKSANSEAGKRGARSAAATAKREQPLDHRTTSLRPTRASSRSCTTTHKRLTDADHDYQGHRVMAMGHIASALQDLGSNSIGISNSLAGPGNLSQSRSDEILRDAMIHLRSTEASLGSGTNRADHHRRAHVAVGQAIRELEVALRIRSAPSEIACGIRPA